AAPSSVPTTDTAASCTRSPSAARPTSGGSARAVTPSAVRTTSSTAATPTSVARARAASPPPPHPPPLPIPTRRPTAPTPLPPRPSAPPPHPPAPPPPARPAIALLPFSVLSLVRTRLSGDRLPVGSHRGAGRAARLPCWRERPLGGRPRLGPVAKRSACRPPD